MAGQADPASTRPRGDVFVSTRSADEGSSRPRFAQAPFRDGSGRGSHAANQISRGKSRNLVAIHPKEAQLGLQRGCSPGDRGASSLWANGGHRAG
jgi:hypothetical protein